MSDRITVVAVYKTPTEAEAAIKELQKWGFNMKRLTIGAKHHNPEKQMAALTTTTNHYDLLRVLIDAGIGIEQKGKGGFGTA